MPKFLVASINEWKEGLHNYAATSIQNLKLKICTMPNTAWTIRIYDFKFALPEMIDFIEGTTLPDEKFIIRIDANGKCSKPEPFVEQTQAQPIPIETDEPEILDVSEATFEAQAEVHREVEAAWDNSGVAQNTAAMVAAMEKKVRPCLATGCSNPSKGPRNRFLCEVHKNAPEADVERWKQEWKVRSREED